MGGGSEKVAWYCIFSFQKDCDARQLASGCGGEEDIDGSKSVWLSTQAQICVRAQTVSQLSGRPLREQQPSWRPGSSLRKKCPMRRKSSSMTFTRSMRSLVRARSAWSGDVFTDTQTRWVCGQLQIFSMISQYSLPAGVCCQDRGRGQVHLLPRPLTGRPEAGGDYLPHAQTPAHRGAAGDLLQVNTLLDPDVF